MKLIDKEKITVIAVGSMNDTHFEEVDMINSFYDKLKDASTSDEMISEDLEAIAHHTIEHFAKEEKNMLKYSFPPFPMHKGEHDRFIAQMVDYQNKWNKTKERRHLIEFLEDVLVDWLYTHIMTMDKITAMYLNSQGVK